MRARLGRRCSDARSGAVVRKQNKNAGHRRGRALVPPAEFPTPHSTTRRYAPPRARYLVYFPRHARERGTAMPNARSGAIRLRRILYNRIASSFSGSHPRLRMATEPQQPAQRRLLSSCAERVFNGPKTRHGNHVRPGRAASPLGPRPAPVPRSSRGHHAQAPRPRL